MRGLYQRQCQYRSIYAYISTHTHTHIYIYTYIHAYIVRNTPTINVTEVQYGASINVSVKVGAYRYYVAKSINMNSELTCTGKYIHTYIHTYI